jgi:CheY-specific phosphatase CheX
MAAGLGFKTFTVGEVLTAADTNGYLMQGVLVFADAAARDAAITAPAEGQFAYTKDTNGLWYYDSSAWVASGATGDIEGVTAGVGISGGGTSGTVTVTNSMATAITTAGDLIKGTGSGTFDRLGIGATGDVLTVAAGTASWAAPAGGTSFSGCAVKNSSGPTISNNTHTIVNYDTEIFDTDSYHSTATNTSRITIPAGKTGYYLVTARGQYGAAAGFTQLNVYKNGAEISAWSNAGTTTTGGTYMTNTGTYYLTAGDYIETDTYQNSGSSQVLDITGNYGYFGVIYLGA